MNKPQIDLELGGLTVYHVNNWYYWFDTNMGLDIGPFMNLHEAMQDYSNRQKNMRQIMPDHAMPYGIPQRDLNFQGNSIKNNVIYVDFVNKCKIAAK